MSTLAACGGGSPASRSDSRSSNEPSNESSNQSPSELATPASASQPTDPFPITVSHDLGSTVIPRAPQRVLALSIRDRDTTFALGVTPLPVRIGADRVVNADRAWAGYATKAPASQFLFNDGVLDYGLVAAVKPDLIVNVTSFMPTPQYDELSKIAPTVSTMGEPGPTWQEVTSALGRVLGRSEGAAKLITELEAGIAKVASDNPDFAGRTFAFAQYSGPTEDVFTSGRGAADSRLLRSLGFELPPMSTRLAPAQFAKLDVDVLLWDAELPPDKKDAIKADSRLRGLAVMQENRAVFLEGDLSAGLFFDSVLSLPFVLERITPLLQGVA